MHRRWRLLLLRLQRRRDGLLSWPRSVVGRDHDALVRHDGRLSLYGLRVEGKVRKAGRVSSKKKKKRVDSRVCSLTQYEEEDGWRQSKGKERE